MDFSITEEQQLLADSIARFVQKDYTFESRRAAIHSETGWSRSAWQTLAEMGVLGLSLPEAHGGFGGGPVDTMLVMQALGRGLVIEPYLSTVVLGGGAIALGGTEAQQAALLPPIIAGEAILAFAHFEPQARYSVYDIRTSAAHHSSAKRYTLNGAKAVVAFGAQADKIVVSARTNADEKLSLFVVDRDTPGIAIRDYRTIDGLRAAEITFTNASVPESALLGVRDKAWPIVEQVLDRGVAAVCAEAVGVMETLNAQTLEYIKTRQQFGQPIGRFQVLQHRAVDMMIHFEQSKSMAILAAMQATNPDTRARQHAISAAKAHIGRSGRLVAQSAIQMHGGMGVTDEMPASHYAKRLTMIDFMLGDAESHIDRMIAH